MVCLHTFYYHVHGDKKFKLSFSLRNIKHIKAALQPLGICGVGNRSLSSSQLPSESGQGQQLIFLLPETGDSRAVNGADITSAHAKLSLAG